MKILAKESSLLKTNPIDRRYVILKMHYTLKN
jgi:hypothetical protein